MSSEPAVGTFGRLLALASTIEQDVTVVRISVRGGIESHAQRMARLPRLVLRHDKLWIPMNDGTVTERDVDPDVAAAAVRALTQAMTAGPRWGHRLDHGQPITHIEAHIDGQTARTRGDTLDQPCDPNDPAWDLAEDTAQARQRLYEAIDSLRKLPGDSRAYLPERFEVWTETSRARRRTHLPPWPYRMPPAPEGTCLTVIADGTWPAAAAQYLHEGQIVTAYARAVLPGERPGERDN